MDDDQNKLYTDFKGRDVLDGISADNFDSLKNDSFITPENKEFFEDLLRVGWLSGQVSSSGPMPNTGKIVSEAFSGSGQTKIIATANAGEVFQIMGVAGKVTSGSGTGTIVLSFTDGVNDVRIESGTITGNNEFNITSTAGPLYIDQNLSIQGVSSGGSFPTEITVFVALQRVR